MNQLFNLWQIWLGQQGWLWQRNRSERLGRWHATGLCHKWKKPDQIWLGNGAGVSGQGLLHQPHPNPECVRTLPVQNPRAASRRVAAKGRLECAADGAGNPLHEEGRAQLVPGVQSVRAEQEAPAVRAEADASQRAARLSAHLPQGHGTDPRWLGRPSRRRKKGDLFSWTVYN